MTSLPEDPVGAALRGPHRTLALGGDGPALRYPPDISPFVSLGPEPGPEAWHALTALPGDVVGLFQQPGMTVAAGWSLRNTISVLQMVAEADAGAPPEPDPDIVALTEADVDEMLDLATRTQPGPFLADTIRFGGYVGIRRDGVLAAMAGRRLVPEGWIEVSAVCSDPAYRGAGLGRRVTAAVTAGIRADGSRPFLHVVPTNPARALYESLGFSVLREANILIATRD